MAHRKKFVTSREIWTLYWLMIAAGLFWGSLSAYLAFVIFRFNHQALMFLGFMTTITGLATGVTTYVGTRQLLDRAHLRSRNADLDLS